jgi:PAS domain S-box-containing protein
MNSGHFSRSVNESVFQSVFERVSIAMSLSHADSGVILDANARFLELIGRDRRETIGSTAEELGLWCDENQPMKMEYMLVRDGHVRDAEVEIRTSAGEHKTVLFSSDYIELNGTQMVLLSGQDITEQRRAIQALKESEARFRLLFESVPIGISLSTRDGRVLEMNRALLEMNKSTREEIVDHGAITDYMSPAEHTAILDKVLAYGRVRDYELRMRRSDGKGYDALLNVDLLDDRGDKELLITQRDVTNQRRTEERLRNNQRLEALRILAGGIAHDFNNLLCEIFGLISLARSSSGRGKSPIAFLDSAIQEFDRAREITSRLLTFSTGGAPTKQSVDIGRLVHNAVRFALSGTNTLAEFCLEKELWQCEVDTGQISQVFENLTINAREAMSDRGVVTVTAHNVPTDNDLSSDLELRPYICLGFSDAGTGIAPENLPRIFDPFFTTKHQGSGLGLTTCYSIIKKHGGMIDVRSEAGKGACFLVYLPAVVGDGVQTSAPKQPQPSSRLGLSRRILVMDDEPLLRSITAEALSEMGYEPSIVEEGRKAIEAVQEAQAQGFPFCAAILDLTVPGGMGGKDAAAEIACIAPELPLIVASGYCDHPVLAAPSAFGFKGRLRKPFLLEELAEVVAAVVGNAEVGTLCPPSDKKPQ